jgi:hypothetical protein
MTKRRDLNRVLIVAALIGFSLASDVRAVAALASARVGRDIEAPRGEDIQAPRGEDPLTPQS